MPAFITFDPVLLTITVSTSAVSSVGVYVLAIAATTDYYDTTLSTPIKMVTVLIDCNPTLISVSTLIPKQTVFIGSQASTVSFGAFTYQPLCPLSSVQYSAGLDSSSPLPTFISFNSAARSFSIDPSLIPSAGSYSITVVGSIG